jgi:meso-butanediol dehydrogenase/(S,S)-butanediol dehydrogenase/diacetyl reductase
MNRFTGKVALVTGAGSGIGKATAIRLASEGASLLLADINEPSLTETVKELPEGAAASLSHLDVSDSGSCNDSVAQCVKVYGRLDILCNIAGIALCEHMTNISDEQWHRMVGINLNGVFFMSRAAVPHLLESKGNIVNMSSSAGLVGQAYNSAYCATKAGVLMFSKSMAIEYAKQGLRVNAVCPGMVKTPLTDNFTMPENVDMDLLGKLFPLMEGAEPEEIAAAVCYLASSEARFVTGAALPIDGAQTAG